MVGEQPEPFVEVATFDAPTAESQQSTSLVERMRVRGEKTEDWQPRTVGAGGVALTHTSADDFDVMKPDFPQTN